MKTFKKQIHTVLISLFVMLSLNLFAQKNTNPKKVFLRVYNLEGKKTGKGNIIFINDSILGLNKNGTQEKISSNNIGSIKTKRSGGHHILVGSLVGGGLLAIIGGTTSKEETKTGDGGWLFGEYEYTTGISPGTGAAIGGISGLIAGAAVGSITGAFKNSETYIIDGDIRKWLNFKEKIEDLRFK